MPHCCLIGYDEQACTLLMWCLAGGEGAVEKSSSGRQQVDVTCSGSYAWGAGSPQVACRRLEVSGGKGWCWRVTAWRTHDLKRAVRMLAAWRMTRRWSAHWQSIGKQTAGVSPPAPRLQRARGRALCTCTHLMVCLRQSGQGSSKAPQEKQGNHQGQDPAFRGANYKILLVVPTPGFPQTVMRCY